MEIQRHIIDCPKCYVPIIFYKVMEVTCPQCARVLKVIPLEGGKCIEVTVIQGGPTDASIS